MKLYVLDHDLNYLGQHLHVITYDCITIHGTQLEADGALIQVAFKTGST